MPESIQVHCTSEAGQSIRILVGSRGGSTYRDSLLTSHYTYARIAGMWIDVLNDMGHTHPGLDGPNVGPTNVSKQPRNQPCTLFFSSPAALPPSFPLGSKENVDAASRFSVKPSRGYEQKLVPPWSPVRKDKLSIPSSGHFLMIDLLPANETSIIHEHTLHPGPRRRNEGDERRSSNALLYY